MSETQELIQNTVKELLERLDALAGKLGIAAEQIWKFTVTAMSVDARRDLAKNACLAVLPLILFGWALHVGFTKIPHDVILTDGEAAIRYLPCDQIGIVNGKQVVLKEQCQVAERGDERKTEGDISYSGWALIASGLLAAFAGILILARAVGGIIDAVANIKTVEYDAFHDLLDTLRD